MHGWVRYVVRRNGSFPCLGPYRCIMVLSGQDIHGGIKAIVWH